MLTSPKEVFLSHAHQDKELATQVAETLRRHGVPVWYSPTNILGAEQWHDEIGAALQRCDWFAVILSPAAVESKWVKRELVYALLENQYDNQVIPLLCKPCSYKELAWELRSIQMVDFTGAFSDGCRDLLRIWGLGYQERS